MIDNITLVKAQKPFKQALQADGRPFEYKGMTYSPMYTGGQLRHYMGILKSLRIYIYPDQVYVCNSLHKYFHGNNFTNFFRSEIKEAIEQLNEETGVSWNGATIKKIEYGCNVSANAAAVSGSLLSYKGKDYLPMHYKGKKYGAVCEFEDYKLKGYDKAFEARQTAQINLSYSLFRWEVAMKRMRPIQAIAGTTDLSTKHLFMPTVLKLLSEDATRKFQNSIKMQRLQLHKLSTHEKRILAEMLVPEIREDLKKHHKETYKRDRRIYRQIMSDKKICDADDTAKALKQKFEELLSL